MKRNSNFRGLTVMALAVLFAFSCEKTNEDALIADRDDMNIVETAQDANVVLADQIASNGIVHVIDKVLLPQEVLDALAPPSH
ncbi:MAG: hypothetical protein E4H26_12710 [Flavobacteriales bacterium]|nr:MAG: hypothetical protein E4H26_12710 [Flavobacteriales bacterium]